MVGSLKRTLCALAVVVGSGAVVATPAHAGLLGSVGTIVKNTTTTVSTTTGGLLGQVLPPPVAQAVNVVPAGYDPLTPLEQLLGGQAGLGTVLEQATCKPLTEVNELATQLNLNPITDGLTSLACSASILEYRLVTRFRRPDGTILERSQVTTLGVPTLLNVDEDSGADMIGTLTLTSLNAVGLTVDRFPGETAQLPISVEAVLRDPTGGLLGREHIAFGYDAQADRAPGRFVMATPIDTILRPRPEFQLNVSQSQRGERVALIGSAFDGSVATRVNPAQVRIDYAKSPDSATLRAAIGDRVGVTLTTNRPGRVDVLGRIVSATQEDRFDASIEDLPGSLGLDVDTTGQLDVRYIAAARVAKIRGTLQRLANAGPTQTLVQKAVLELDDVPTGLTAAQSGAGGAVTTTGGPIGRTKIGIADGEPRFLTGEPAYLNLDDDGTVDSVALQLPGIERATFAADGGFDVSAKLAATPLRARLVQPGRTIDARVQQLPREFDIAFDPEGTVLDYDGKGDGIERITLTGDSDEPFFGRATKLRGTIEGIPAEMRAALDTAGGRTGVTVDGTGPLGKVELVASNGPEQLPAGDGQGVVYRDLTGGDFLIGARVLELRRLAVSTADALELDAFTKGGPFSVDARTDGFEAVGSVEDLPAQTSLGFDQDAARLTFAGKDAGGAPQGIERLDLEARSIGGTLVGRADHVDAHVEGIPAELTLDAAQDGEGLAVDANAPIGLIELVAANRAAQAGDLPAGGEQGAKVVDLTGGDFVIGARVRELKKLAASLGRPLSITTETAGGPFGVRVTTDDLRAQARIEDLPAKLAATIDLDAGRLTVDGRTADDQPQGIERLTLDADSDEPLFGRATHVKADVRSIPSTLSLDLAQEGGGIDLSANEPVGSIEVAAANRAVDLGADLPANGEQGARFVDKGADYALGARIRRLKRVSARVAGDIAVATETEGGPFGIHAELENLTADARIEDLPAKLDVALDLEALKLSVDGHGQEIGRITAKVDGTEALVARATDIDARIEGIPSALTVDIAQSGQGIDLRANEPVGLIEVVARDGDIADPAADLPVNDEQGAKYVDRHGGEFALGVRVRDLKRISADVADDVQLSTETEGGPFGVRLDTDELQAHARVEDLPAKLDATLDLDAGRLTVDGHGEGIARILADVVSSSPLFGRATNVHALIEDIPSALTVDLAQTGDGIDLTANEPIGLIEVAAASRALDLATDLPVNGEQGAKFLDRTGEDFVVGARVRKLKSVSARISDTVRIATETEGGPFGLRVVTDDVSGLARIEDLPAKLTAALDLDAGKVTVTGRDADDEPQRIDRLTVDVEAAQALFGRATNIRADVRGIPSDLLLDIAQDGDGARLEASEPIDALELVAANRAPEGGDLPAGGEQGAKFVDLTDGEYAIGARVRKFKKVAGHFGQTTSVSTITEGGPFGIRATTDDLRAAARVADLPAKLDATLDLEAGKLTIDGRDEDDSPSDAIGLLTLAADADEPLFGRATDVAAVVRDVPSQVTLDIAQTGSGARITADPAIGSVELVAADRDITDMAADLPAGDEQGAIYKDRPGTYLVGARVRELKKIDAALGDTVSLGAETAGGPFSVLAETADLNARLRFQDLPQKVDASFDTAGGAFAFDGFDGDGNPKGMDLVTLDVAGTDGPVFARATRVNATIKKLAPHVALTIDPEAPSADVEASAPVEELSILATDIPEGDPVPELPAGEQGAIFHDVDGQPFVLRARLYDLEDIRFGFGGENIGINAKLRSTPFSVDVKSADLNANARIDKLPASTTLGFDLDQGGFSYEGEDGDGNPAPVDSIRFEATSDEPLFGRATKLKGELLDVPARITVGFDTSAGGANVTIPDGQHLGALTLLASDGSEQYPADQGVIYHDSPSRFLVAAKVAGLKTLGVDLAENIGLDIVRTAGSPFTADIDVDDLLTATASIVDLPADAELSVDLNPDEPLEPGALTFKGRDQDGNPVGIQTLDLAANATEPIFGAGTAIQGHIEQLPSDVEISFGQQAAKASVKAINPNGGPVQPVGRIELAASDTAGQFLYPTNADNTPAQGAVLHTKTGEPFRLGVRILNLENLTVDFGSAINLTTKTAGGPFLADVKTDSFSADAEIQDLPPQLDLGLDLESGQIEYAGSQGIGRIFAKVEGQEPLFLGATGLEAEFLGVPQAFSLSLAQGGAEEASDLNGLRLESASPIDQISIRAKSPNRGYPTIPAGQAGAILDSTLTAAERAADPTQEQLALAIRVYKLQLLDVGLDPVSLEARMEAGRPFIVDAKLPQRDDNEQLLPNPLAVQATIDKLPANVKLALEDLPGSTEANPLGSRLSLLGSARIDLLKLGVQGLELLPGADKVDAQIEDIPQALRIDLPTTGPLASIAATDQNGVSTDIGQIRLAAGSGTVAAPADTYNLATRTSNADDRLDFDQTGTFSVSTRLTAVKTLSLNLEPIGIKLTQDAPRTRPVRLDAKLPNASGPPSSLIGLLNRPTAATGISAVLEDGQPTRLQFTNAGQMNRLELKATNLGDLPLVDTSLDNLPDVLKLCLHTGSLCERPNPTPITNNNGAAHNGRPYPAKVSIDFDDQGTSAPGEPMVILNAVIDLGEGGEPVRVTDLRFRNISLDFGENGVDTSGPAGADVPRIYMFFDSRERPFAMNSLKYPPDIQEFKIGTNGNPARARSRTVWLREANFFGLTTHSSGGMNCGGQQVLTLKLPVFGNVNVLDFPVLGQLVPVCGGSVNTAVQ